MNQFRIEYQRQAQAGLLAATSPDLPGFLVIAKDLDQLLAEIPTVAADLIRQRTGNDVEVVWVEQEETVGGFAPLGSEVKILELA